MQTQPPARDSNFHRVRECECLLREYNTVLLHNSSPHTFFRFHLCHILYRFASLNLTVFVQIKINVGIFRVKNILLHLCTLCRDSSHFVKVFHSSTCWKVHDPKPRAIVWTCSSFLCLQADLSRGLWDQPIEEESPQNPHETLVCFL